MEEHLLKIVDGDPAEVVQRLKEKGVRVRQRFGDTLVVEGKLAPDLGTEVSRLVREIPASSIAAAPAGARDEDILPLAFQLRQTEGFRKAKRERATEGEDWGEIFERM